MSKTLDILCENMAKLLNGRSNYWLAEESGLNQGTLSRIRSKTLNPSIESIEAIAKALRVTPAELLTSGVKPAIPADILEALENQSPVVYDAIRGMIKAFAKEKAQTVLTAKKKTQVKRAPAR